MLMKLSAALIYIERNALRERIQEYSFHMTVCRCKRVFRHFVKRCPLLHPALTPRVGILYLWYTKKSFPVTGSRPVRMCAVLFKEGHCYWQLPPPPHNISLKCIEIKKKKKGWKNALNNLFFINKAMIGFKILHDSTLKPKVPSCLC